MLPPLHQGPLQARAPGWVCVNDSGRDCHLCLPSEAPGREEIRQSGSHAVNTTKSGATRPLFNVNLKSPEIKAKHRGIWTASLCQRCQALTHSSGCEKLLSCQGSRITAFQVRELCSCLSRLLSFPRSTRFVGIWLPLSVENKAVHLWPRARISREADPFPSRKLERPFLIPWFMIIRPFCFKQKETGVSYTS